MGFFIRSDAGVLLGDMLDAAWRWKHGMGDGQHRPVRHQQISPLSQRDHGQPAPLPASYLWVSWALQHALGLVLGLWLLRHAGSVLLAAGAAVAWARALAERHTAWWVSKGAFLHENVLVD